MPIIDSRYLSSVPGSVALESAQCPVCKTNINQLHQFDAVDRINNLEGLFGIDLCAKCGVYITNPRPTQQTIGYYYPDSYGPYSSTYISAPTAKSRIFGALRAFIRTNENYIPKMPPQSLLDIGCASGSFINRMKQLGWVVEGLEFSQSAVNSARENGLNVHQGSVLDFDGEPEKFDLITAWMVIEHIHEPITALEKIYSWLKPSGKLAISIPNAASFDFKSLEACSYGIHIPNHLHHFTPTTITGILTDAGFSNIKIHHQVTMASAIPSIGYKLREKGKALKIADALIEYPRAPHYVKLLMLPISWLFSALGQTGRMTVWASKT